MHVYCVVEPKNLWCTYVCVIKKKTNFIELATKVMAGLPAIPKDIKLLGLFFRLYFFQSVVVFNPFFFVDLDYVGVKAPMFRFVLRRAL